MIGLIKGTARQAKTVSGLPLPIASYKSNSKSPLKELSLSINPTQSGSGDPAPDNIRPITGVSSVNVSRTGKNICGSVIESGSFDDSGLNTVNNIRVRTKDYIPVKAGQTISVSFDHPTVSQGFFALSGYTKDDFTTPRIQSTSWIADGGSVTIDSGVKFIRLNFRKDNNAPVSADEILNVMVVYGSAASDYSAYQGNTYLISLGDTYYGATLDVDENGNVKLRADRVYDLIKNHNWILGTYTFYAQDFTNKAAYNAEMICDIYKTVPAPGTSQDMPDCSIKGVNATSSQYRREVYLKDTRYSTVEALVEAVGDYGICYKLYTPIEIDLGNLSIPSLLGQNNIWHDGNGNVEVLKFMDRQLYFGR